MSVSPTDINHLTSAILSVVERLETQNAILRKIWERLETTNINLADIALGFPKEPDA
jgi:hypothetical protein